jgi:hypothetical protein
MTYISPPVLLPVCVEYIYLRLKIKSFSCLLPARYWVGDNHILVPKRSTGILAWFPALMMTRGFFSGYRLSVDPHARVNFR